MTFTQLKYFVEAVRHQSINAAADACFVSYNAMYKAIKNLETELQFLLLERTATGVSLTPEGKLFYKDAQTILQLEQKWCHFSAKKKAAAANCCDLCHSHFL